MLEGVSSVANFILLIERLIKSRLTFSIYNMFFISKPFRNYFEDLHIFIISCCQYKYVINEDDLEVKTRKMKITNRARLFKASLA